MEKILLDVDYEDTTGKFWQDSYIKNKIITIDKDINEKIAETIKEVDGIILLYNNKPRSNVFVDNEKGNPKIIGYIYRGKTEIYNDDKRKYEKALFNVWATIRKVEDYPIKEI